MAYFTEIPSDRRFVAPDGDVVAIYDQRRAYTLYAPVGTDKNGKICFVGEPRVYSPAQVQEILDGYVPRLGRTIAYT